MWENYPLNWSLQDRYPCKSSDGSPVFHSECSIRLSIALQRGGVNLDSCPKTKCGFHTEKHFIRAQEPASWFTAKSVLGKPQTFPKKRWTPLTTQQANQFYNHRGIVFFQNFYNPDATPDNPEVPPYTGDHIDLWNISRLTGDFGPNWNWTYFNRAENIWFWEIKS